MQLQSQPAQQTAESSELARPLACYDTCHSDRTASQAAIADVLDDSYWEDLPDLAENSSSDLPLADLFSIDLSVWPFTPVSQPQACSLNANLFSPEQLNDPIFSETLYSLADMDTDSVLAEASDFSLTMLPEKQLQPGTPSGQAQHMNDILLESCLPRSHTPVSKDNGPLCIASQDSVAMVSSTQLAEVWAKLVG